MYSGDTEPNVPNPFLEAAAAARHDLGKYIAFELRWVGDSASPGDLLSALQADVLRTRSANSVDLDAVTVWKGVRGGLAGLSGLDADVDAVDEAMDRIERRLAGLRAGTLDIEELQACAADAFVVSHHLDALYRRLKEE